MNIYYLLLLTFCSFSLSAQQQTFEYGVVTEEERNMDVYEKDTEAEAVVLFDLGRTKFVKGERNYDIQFKYHTRLKIFNKAGLDRAEIEIPYYVDGYGRTEVIKNIEAVSYTLENGQWNRQVLNAKSIFKEQVSEHTYVKKFVIPNVQEGSIIEYRYMKVTPFIFRLPDWQFQDRIPVMYSEYEVAMIPFYEYIFLAQGIESFDYQNSRKGTERRTWGQVISDKGMHTGDGVIFQDVISTYALKDIPAFKDESYITSVSDHIIKLDFQLSKVSPPYGKVEEIMSTWYKLNTALLEHEDFGRYMKVSQRLAKKVLEDIDLDGKSEAAQLKTLIDYTKSHFTWNDQRAKYANQTPKQFLATKSGNAAEINLFLIALLREAGFDVTPVVLSTRGHGQFRTTYPFNNMTDYVVAFIDWDVAFLADATDDHLPFDRIPLRCINGLGLLVNESEEGEWLRIAHDEPSTRKYTISTTIHPEDMEAKHVLSMQNTEYNSYVLRTSFEDDEEEIKEAFTENIDNITRVKTVNYDRPSAPYMLFFEGTSEVEHLGGHIVVKPFLNLGIAENKLKQEERSYPVDFTYPTATTFDIRVLIPEGYELDQLPQAVEHEDDLIQLVMNAKLDEHMVLIEAGYVFKQSVYEPANYKQLKKDIDEIVATFQKDIVLIESRDRVVQNKE
jgi:hypothetical protein